MMSMCTYDASLAWTAGTDPYCCLYCRYARRRQYGFRQHPWNPGWSVMQSQLTSPASIRPSNCFISLQQTDSTAVGIFWQWPQLHLNNKTIDNRTRNVKKSVQVLSNRNNGVITKTVNLCSRGISVFLSCYKLQLYNKRTKAKRLASRSLRKGENIFNYRSQIAVFVTMHKGKNG